MLLGKRPRTPMRRTTSMSLFSGDDLAGVEAAIQPSDQLGIGHQHHHQRRPEHTAEIVAGGGDGDWLGALVSPTSRGRVGQRRNSGDFAVVKTAHFLRACELCKRRLGAGRDIFMYRGDVAFCSLECRQQQMNLDERQEKCSLTSMKDASAATSGSEQATGDGVAAA